MIVEPHRSILQKSLQFTNKTLSLLLCQNTREWMTLPKRKLYVDHKKNNNTPCIVVLFAKKNKRTKILFSDY